MVGVLPIVKPSSNQVLSAKHEHLKNWEKSTTKQAQNSEQNSDSFDLLLTQFWVSFVNCGHPYYIVESGLENGWTLGLRVWELLLGLISISFPEHGLNKNKMFRTFKCHGDVSGV